MAFVLPGFEHHDEETGELSGDLYDTSHVPHEMRRKERERKQLLQL